MIRIHTLLASLALGLVVSACSSTPPVKYYKLATPTLEQPAQTSALVLVVEDFTASPVYDDMRIIYRQNAYTLDYYHYHRWSAPPSVLVTDALRAGLDRSGRYKGILSSFSPTADAILTGRVIAFEEVDETSAWFAHAEVAVEIRSTLDGSLLWSSQLEARQKLAKRNPEGLAQAMTQAMADINTQIQSAITQRVKPRPAAPSTPLVVE